ncbi:hypothetical protein MTO96_038149 [Rhipicephalus appendiculatus]
MRVCPSVGCAVGHILRAARNARSAFKCRMWCGFGGRGADSAQENSRWRRGTAPAGLKMMNCSYKEDFHPPALDLDPEGARAPGLTGALGRQLGRIRLGSGLRKGGVGAVPQRRSLAT